MQDTDVSERVARLEHRVSFLESELETSYDEQKFKNNIEAVSPDSARIEYDSGHFGYYAKVMDIDGDQAQTMIDSLKRKELEYALTETCAGLGLEIWSDRKI
jgi:hypothetical protein